MKEVIAVVSCIILVLQGLILRMASLPEAWSEAWWLKKDYLSSLGLIENGITPRSLFRSLVAEKRSPIILVPGIGGSRIEAKLDKKETVHWYCDKKTSDFFLLWLERMNMIPVLIDCFIDNMKLNYNSKTKKLTNSVGVDIRVPGWGDPDVVDYLNPERFAESAYFKELSDMLVDDLGYIRRQSLLAAPYDFRKGPSTNQEFFQNLKALVEKSYSTNYNQKVTLVAHSMGGLMTLIFLQNQDQAWKDKYISSWITLNTPWGGSMDSLNTFTNGAKLHFIVRPKKIKELLVTFPSLAFLLPTEIAWSSRDVLVQSGVGSFKLADLQKFLKEIGLPDVAEFYEDNKKYLNDTRPPGAIHHCFRGSGVSTPEKLVYNYDGSLSDDPSVINGNGDGTVNLKSLEACDRWTNKQEQPIYHKTFFGVDHQGILRKNQEVFEAIKDILKKKRS